MPETDFARLAPAKGASLAVLGGCGGIGRALVQAAIGIGLKVAVLDLPRSIAESFQDMLRIAYQAGAASAATGEIFETWYQREVLQ